MRKNNHKDMGKFRITKSKMIVKRIRNSKGV